ncbi:MAG: hypothetical protein LBK44_06645 [Spirochaetales bacterium]|nr:hypothetical protein [Spirochaetales bacterium]
MRFLWAFRYNPLRTPSGGQRIYECKFATNPLRPTTCKKMTVSRFAQFSITLYVRQVTTLWSSDYG